MLSSIELSARELGTLKLMADFFAEKPELTAKIEAYTTAHYALLTTYAENFGIPSEDATKVLEDLGKKIAEAQYVQVKLPPLRNLVPMQREELDMLRVVIDYFSEEPKMTSAGSLLSTRSEILADAYHWFYGKNAEVAREILQNLTEKLQKAMFVRTETLAEIGPTLLNPYEAALTARHSCQETGA
jgi:hypothetical protein